jgi:hypothetical protein
VLVRIDQRFAEFLKSTELRSQRFCQHGGRPDVRNTMGLGFGPGADYQEPPDGATVMVMATLAGRLAGCRKESL